jgi:hypothetical protein
MESGCAKSKADADISYPECNRSWDELLERVQVLEAKMI